MRQCVSTWPDLGIRFQKPSLVGPSLVADNAQPNNDIPRAVPHQHGATCLGRFYLSMCAEGRSAITMIDKGQTYKRRARARGERASSFWSSDWSLTVLLWLLIGNIFALPLDRFVPWGRLAARALLSLIIISGVVATARSRRFIAVTATFVLMYLFMGWEGVQRPNTRYLGVFNDLASLLFFGFFIVLILRQVLRTRRPDHLAQSSRGNCCLSADGSAVGLGV